MNHHEVLIVGGGNAGISLAARLLRDGVRDVAIMEPQPVHRYRPLLNYVGGGEARMSSLERPAADVIPDGCTWYDEQVVAVDGQGPSVLTRDGQRLGCSTLVLCPGLEEEWDATPGLLDAYAGGPLPPAAHLLPSHPAWEGLISRSAEARSPQPSAPHRPRGRPRG